MDPSFRWDDDARAVSVENATLAQAMSRRLAFEQSSQRKLGSTSFNASVESLLPA
jgi:hypothetical protein